MRSIKRSEGFTLIELMIVVAIIGILAAIAIPNFLKFQCKSKQSEAKVNLAGIFTAETAFFGEYNTYGTDLLSVNWVPDGAPLYLYGFLGGQTVPAAVAGIPSYTPGNNSTLNATVIGSPARYATTKMNNLAGSPLVPADFTGSPASTCAGNIFIAAAVGDVEPQQSAVYDNWTMDSEKDLLVEINDCTS